MSISGERDTTAQWKKSGYAIQMYIKHCSLNEGNLETDWGTFLNIFVGICHKSVCTSSFDLSWQIKNNNEFKKNWMEVQNQVIS